VTRSYTKVSSYGDRLASTGSLTGSLTCSACQRSLPAESFHLSKYGSRSSWCRECTVAATREWRAANRDAINARRRAEYARRTRSDV
jgi:hypothetical protein